MSSRPNVARTSSKDPMLVMAERDCLILSRSDRLVPALVGSAMVDSIVEVFTGKYFWRERDSTWQDRLDCDYLE